MYFFASYKYPKGPGERIQRGEPASDDTPCALAGTRRVAAGRRPSIVGAVVRLSGSGERRRGVQATPRNFLHLNFFPCLFSAYDELMRAVWSSVGFLLFAPRDQEQDS